jgi:glycosyltransferase involved in cell wall biosynthesis
MSRSGMHPIRELRTILAFRSVLRREKPDIILTWTPKPNIYMGLVADRRHFRLIPNVAGLGTLFVQQGTLSRFVGWLYRAAFRDRQTVFFQNREDRDAFVAAGWVDELAAQVLPGSGVDLQRFTLTPLPGEIPLTFLFGGRLLKQKGLPELILACRSLRKDGLPFRLLAYGHFDPGNPKAISESTMAAWVSEGLVDYRGSSDCMETSLGECDCVVHPSYYREGVPRILLEAAACGRPTVTTDSVGCREAVVDGETGFLCGPRDPVDLARAMCRMIQLPAEKRESMGRAARRFAESKFDESIIVAEYLAAIGH